MKLLLIFWSPTYEMLWLSYVGRDFECNCYIYICNKSVFFKTYWNIISIKAFHIHVYGRCVVRRAMRGRNDYPQPYLWWVCFSASAVHFKWFYVHPDRYSRIPLILMLWISLLLRQLWKYSPSLEILCNGLESVSILIVLVSPDVLCLIPTNSKKLRKKYTCKGTWTPVSQQLKEISKWNTPLISCAA